MAVVRRSPLDPYPVTSKYLSTRNSALHIPASQFPKFKIKPEDVYGVVIDAPMGINALVTMVCFINGAANLYFNNGSEYTGASTRYKAVVQAARNLVVNAAPLRNLAKHTSIFPLPTYGTYFVYLLTKRGCFRTELHPSSLREEEKEKRVVYYMSQQVMSALRMAQLRDAEGLPEGGKKDE